MLVLDLDGSDDMDLVVTAAQRTDVVSQFDVQSHLFARAKQVVLVEHVVFAELGRPRRRAAEVQLRNLQRGPQVGPLQRRHQPRLMPLPGCTIQVYWQWTQVRASPSWSSSRRRPSST